MKTINFKRFIQKTILTTFIISVCFVGNSYAEQDVFESNAIRLLESVRQNYYAYERLVSLKNNYAVNINKNVPAKMWLKKVNASEVNMVTNRFTGEQQNAVIINNKHYFANGKEYAFNLQDNSSLLYSIDPLTNMTIDKADAVTYSDASGRVLYFESDMTFERFLGLANTETLYGYSK
ncbi:MAG TPA: hypothetical protein VFF47_06705 [Nitrospirota bacterium]|nr:hypothetical protein [Nitrospirota bacterium]